ncbi:PREDICTED: lebercilin-like protein [Cariama cristata]|uniref:lebercilin-like protein n=1 Tax=Cariama cristata TaxID=54380 RepID=UPI0005209BE8|nr:PREDICTED: lebercilin-like protein [Cariama cristata]
MIAGDAVEITEVKTLQALPVTCSETVRSSKHFEISGAEEKKTQEKEKKKKEKKEKIYFGLNAGGKKLTAEKIPREDPSFLSLQSSVTSQDTYALAQQIGAALYEIKDLKNEIFELQHKLEQSSSENHILKQLQCRHLKAIGRYNNSKNNLPHLLASHDNEVKSLRKLLRVSQENEKNTSRKIRTVEAELLKAKNALQTLHMLSEDKTLAEKEELDRRLSAIAEKTEVNDKRIQSLEQQLKLNSIIFSRQLAIENKKAVEVGIITKNMNTEIRCLHQLIKEKDRQLYIQNTYANWMRKNPKDKCDSVPHEKSLGINRSVPVEKQRFPLPLLAQYQTQKTAKSLIQLKKEKKSSEVKNQKAKANEASTDAQCRTEEQSTKQIPNPEPCNRRHREYLRKGRQPIEEHVYLEFMEEKLKESDLLKRKVKKLMKTEQTSLSDGVKENNQEEDAVEDYEKEEKKPDEQLRNSEKAGSKCVTPDPRQKTIKLQKKDIFSEATENLHHRPLTSGTKPKKGSLCNGRHAGQDCSKTAESKVENSFGPYEPSFGKVPKTRQEESSEAEGCTQTTFGEIC